MAGTWLDLKSGTFFWPKFSVLGPKILFLTPFSLKTLSIKGEGGTPQIRNLFFDQNQVFFEQKTQFLALFEEKFSGKRGFPPPPPFTDKIRKLVFEVFSKVFTLPQSWQFDDN